MFLIRFFMLDPFLVFYTFIYFIYHVPSCSALSKHLFHSSYFFFVAIKLSFLLFFCSFHYFALTFRSIQGILQVFLAWKFIKIKYLYVFVYALLQWNSNFIFFNKAFQKLCLIKCISSFFVSVFVCVFLLKNWCL